MIAAGDTPVFYYSVIKVFKEEKLKSYSIYLGITYANDTQTGNNMVYIE